MYLLQIDQSWILSKVNRCVLTIFLGAGFCEKSRQDNFRTTLHLSISIWVTLYYHIYSMRIYGDELKLL